MPSITVAPAMKKLVLLTLVSFAVFGCASPRLADSESVLSPPVQPAMAAPPENAGPTRVEQTDTLFPVIAINKKTPPTPVEPTAAPQDGVVSAGDGYPTLIDRPPQAGTDTTTNEAPKTVEGYILRPMDQIMVNILDPIRQTTEDIINEQGFITLQHLGRVQAAGHTTSSLEEAIAKAYLDAQIFNTITVNVLVPLRFYSVQGEVNRPSRYPLSGVLTLLEAISDAGNFTEYADRKKVDIIRNGQSSSYNYNEALQDPAKNPVIQPNDIIRVRRGW